MACICLCSGLALAEENVITHVSQNCEAKATIDYLQRNTIASVEGRIENSYCGASSGTYIIRVRVRGDDGEIQQFSHEESWQREDHSAVEFSHNYAIPENVDLLNVRIRRLRCLCAESQNLQNDTRPVPEQGENND